MNYLAHLYFAGEEEGKIVGNFLGDFAKGPLHSIDYPDEIISGIRMHRHLDILADKRIIKVLENSRIEFRHRRYAGIVFDLACDHFLARYWQDFHEQGKKHFSNSRMAILKKHEHFFNNKASQVLGRMEQYRWLENYQNIDFIEQVFAGIHKRFPKDNNIDKAFMDLNNNYQALEYYCLDFLQELSRSLLPPNESNKSINQKQ